jgi:hypothetical protein
MHRISAEPVWCPKRGTKQNNLEKIFMKHLHLKTLGMAQFTYLFLSSAAVAAPLPDGTYSDTNFGTVEMTCTETGYWNCTATYEDGQSFLFVDRNAIEGQYFGYWAEPKSDVPCETTDDFGEIRTDAWGQVEMSFDTASESWTGSWGYCDEPLTYAFDGTRGAQGGVEPTAGHLTAQGVLDSWISLNETNPNTSSSYRFDLTEGGLIVSDYNLTISAPDGDLSISVPEIVLTEEDDGSVTVTTSGVSLLSLPTPGPGRIEVTINQPDGLWFVVSGGEDHKSYSLFTPKTTFEVGATDGIALDMTLLGMSADLDFDHINGLSLGSSVDVEMMTVDGQFTDPDSGEAVFLSVSLAEFKTNFEGTLLDVLASMSLEQGLSSGFAVNGAVSHGEISYDITSNSNTSSFASNGEIASGMLDLAVSDGQLSTSGGFNGVALALSGSEVPFPKINVAWLESAFKVAMPLTQSDFPSDIALLFKLVDLSVSDDIWDIFDPTALLPSDPATLVVDISGRGNWLVNIFDQEAQASISGEMDGMVHSATLNELTLSAVGSELTGKGGFTFDYSDMTTFAGLPKPTGSTNLQLIGGNGLLDKLIAMGLVPEEQAMGARMMMGLFATMVVGSEDTITSEIVIEEDGSIFANGQRLQ